VRKNEKMRCPTCHSAAGEQDRFCRNCGGRLAGTDTVRAGRDEWLLPRRRAPLVLVAVYVALGVGSALAVFFWLERGVHTGTVTLGVPRLMVQGGQPPHADAATPADTLADTHPAPRRVVRPRPHAPDVQRPPAPPPDTPKPPPAKGASDVGSAGKPAGSAPGAQDRSAPRKPESTSGSEPESKPENPQDSIDRFRAGLNADSVRMVVQHHLPQVRACYDRALKQQATLKGIVEIRFTISEQGAATSSGVHRNTTGHLGLGLCLAVIVKRWRYPRPVGGAVEFVYPFVFSSGD